MSIPELDSLLDRIRNISLDEEEINLEINEMARNENTVTNYQLLKLYLDSIPHYEGNPHTLGIFVDNCENLRRTFANDANPADPINNFIVRAIVGKLSGRALSLIGSRIELQTWEEIKNALNLSFGDQRNIDCLVQDLIALRPNRNETPYNFGMRCQDARSLIISKLNSLGLDPAERNIRLQNYDDLALKTFIRGLSGQVQNNVRLRNPENLEKAMSLVIEEENFLYSQQRSNTLNSHVSYKPVQRITPVRPNNFNYQNQKYSFPNSNATYNTPFRPNFASINNQPIFKPFTANPMQQRPNFSNGPGNYMQLRPNNSFPIQRQNFNQNRPFQNNPFQQQHNQPPRSQRSQNFNQNRQFQNSMRNYKPEPMDTSSGNTIQPRKTFTSTELFQQNINDTDQFENPFEIQNFADQYYHDNNEFETYDTNIAQDQTFNDPYYETANTNWFEQNPNNYENQNSENNENFQQTPNSTSPT